MGCQGVNIETMELRNYVLIGNVIRIVMPIALGLQKHKVRDRCIGTPNNCFQQMEREFMERAIVLSNYLLLVS